VRFAREESDANLKTFFQLCKLTADVLAADRSTKFLPIIVAQGFFVGSIAVAIAKLTADPYSTSFYLNVEVYSIAFSALFFWILPAVFLTSVIGVSQTKNAMPRILQRLQDGFNHELLDPRIVFPNEVLDEEQRRVISGGIYSWKPDRKGVKGPKQLELLISLLQQNFLPLMIVIDGTLTAFLVSNHVPPEGWETRLCAQSMVLLTWLLSFTLTIILKRNRSSQSYKDEGRFLKDLLATIAIIAGVIMPLIGIFNRCDSYTRWGRIGLPLPNQPDTQTVLIHRIRTVYPAIIFTSIGLQMFVIPVIIVIWYRNALLVFMQRDDKNSGPPWFLEWRWAKRDKTSSYGNQRSQNFEAKLKTLTKVVVLSDSDEKIAAKDGTQIEVVELHPRMQAEEIELDSRTQAEEAELDSRTQAEE
jgi:hypothetical protein